MMWCVAGLDPGRDKCGLAVLDREGQTLWQQVIPTEALEVQLQQAVGQYGFQKLVMGNGTTSGRAKKRVQAVLPELEVIVADEYRTTDQARQEYWAAKPPTGWRRLVPRGMLVPPEPVDDFAAVILARRYIEGQA